MPNSPEHDLLIELQDLIIGTETVADFLSGLSSVAAEAISNSAGTHVECGVTLKHGRATRTVGGSSDRAIRLDQIEQNLGQGPCIESLRIKSPVLLSDVRSDPRWPAYQEVLSAEGCFSALGVPLELSKDSSAALNFFADRVGAFTEATIREATGFARIARRAVQLVVQVATARDAALDLQAAMRSRTAIDLACGIVMAQNNCTQAEAMAVLVKAASHRNQKLRDLAEEMILRSSGNKPVTHFD